MSATTSILVKFNGVDGTDPAGGLIADANGDLFGTTVYGGPGGTPGYASGNGTVFEIPYSASTGYASTPTVLVDFDGADGTAPLGSLLADANGDLFGTTKYGGANGSGTVFEITYSTQTGYATTPTVLASFTAGALPRSDLIEDANGDLFGVTGQDGTYRGGTVFEITKTATGYASTPNVLASFNALSGGEFPIGGLITDAAGDLFGTTDEGGANGYGTAFEIVKTAFGYASSPTVLVNFDASTEGQFASLVADANGDLFGTTDIGGAYNGGAVYEIAKTATGYANTATVLASFNGPVAHNGPELNTDGSYPIDTLIIDAEGNLFGTTDYGGATGDGTAFEVAKTPTGYATTPTVLYSFSGSGGDGALPASGVIADANGDLLGTTEEGGTSNGGTVFEITDSGFLQSGTGPEEFFQGQAVTSGPLTGDFLWSNAANWTDGVPFDNDSAISKVQGIDDVAALTLGELDLLTAGTVVAIQDLTVDILVADASSTVFANTTLPGSAASVTVSIGAFSGTAGNYGAAGSGAVLADNATTSPGGALYIASYDGKIAVANDLTVGGATPGALEVTTGGQVTSVNGNIESGSATVDGSGSSWSMSGALTIGAAGDTAAPSLTVSDDATVTADQSTEDYVLSGSLTLETGGQLTEDVMSVHNAGTLTVESDAVLNEVAASPNPTSLGLYGNGQIFFNDGTLASDNEFTVIGGKTTNGGTEAGNGTLTASNGAFVRTLATYIGYDSGDTGTLILSGSGTVWGDDFEDSLDNNDGGINVGVNGTGNLTVEDGAALSNPQAYIKIGQFKGSTGTALVTGSGSAMSAGGLLRVGDSGAGTLTIADSGVVVAGQVQVSDYGTSTGTLDIDPGSRLSTNGFSTVDVGAQAIADSGTIQVAAGSFGIGVQGGSNGYVTINGGTLTVQGDMIVGDSGSGYLTVEDGGTVSVQGQLAVGESGFGELTIQADGTVSAGSMVIGDHPRGYNNGNVLVTDSTLIVQGSLAFGTTGSGTLFVEGGGRVSVGTLDIGDRGGQGRLVLGTGGTLTAGSILIGPDADIEMEGGVLDPPNQISIEALGGISGYGTVAGAVDNMGSITADGGALEVTGGITGTGTITISAGADFIADSAVSAGETIDNNGTLAIADMADFHATVIGSGTEIATCYLRGTKILTPSGEVNIEDLHAGDPVMTLVAGEAVPKPVKWIGHRSVKPGELAPDDAHPVRIKADAFAPGRPHRDLLVTSEHCIFVDGGLTPARMLVNGRSIVIEREITSFNYFHVELEEHAILFAEGLPAESFLDTGNREKFANAGIARRHPSVTMHTEHKTWGDAAAPLQVDRADVEPIWHRLNARAQSLGLAPTTPDALLTSDPDLRLISVDGLVIRPFRSGGGRYDFAIPAHESDFRLISRSARRSDTIGPFVDDRCERGVLVGAVTLHDGPKAHLLRNHLIERQATGWLAIEGGSHRWTNGCAQLPLASLGPRSENAVLEIQISHGGPYRLPPGQITPGRLRGYVDQITPDGIIAGWAQDEDNPELPVLLEVLTNGQVIGTVLACEYRGDLAGAHIGHGRCGFACKLPAEIAGKSKGQIWIRRAADGTNLAFSHDLWGWAGRGDVQQNNSPALVEAA